MDTLSNGTIYSYTFRVCQYSCRVMYLYLLWRPHFLFKQLMGVDYFVIVDWAPNLNCNVSFYFEDYLVMIGIEFGDLCNGRLN